MVQMLARVLVLKLVYKLEGQMVVKLALVLVLKLVCMSELQMLAFAWEL